MTDPERHPSDGRPIVAFATASDFETWLDEHHDTEDALWVKFAKRGSGIPSITMGEAVEVGLCFGWIDARLNPIDDHHFLLRYQRRRPRSNWSARNKATAERLIAEGRMRRAGQAAIDAAKADGRWDRNT